MVPDDEVPLDILAEGRPIDLGDGVEGHELRVAGSGEAFGKAFLEGVGFKGSFLGSTEVEFLRMFWD